MTIHLCVAQCPNFSSINQILFSQTQSNTPSRLDSLKNWERNWDLCKFPKDSSLAILNYRIGNCHVFNRNHKLALKYFLQAIKYLKRNDTKISWQPKANFKMGVCLTFILEYEIAKKYFRQTLAAPGDKYDSFKMECYYYLAYINKELGDYEVALNYLSKTIFLAKSLDIPSYQSRCYAEKGVLQLYLNHFSEAYSDLKLAEKFSTDNAQKSIALEHLANYFEGIEQYQKAIEHHKLALNLTDDYNKSTIFINFGRLYFLKLKDLEKAEYYYKKALELSTDNLERITIYTKLANIYTEKKDFKMGLKYFNRGNNLAFGIDSDKEITQKQKNSLKYNSYINQLYLLNFEKAKTLKKFGESKNNISILNQSISSFLITSQLIDNMRREHQATESKYYWRNKTRPIYESAIETCLLLKDYEKAFYFFEKSRSVMLNDKLNEMGAKQKLSVEDQKKEMEFISKILDLNATIEKEKDLKKIEELKTKQSELTESQSQFIKSLETKNPAYYQMKYDTNTVTLKQMQAYLKINFKGKPATIVEYFMGNSATYALVVSADKAEIKKLEFDAKLADAFLRLSSQKLNTKSKLDSLNQISFALNNQLIRPLNIQKGHLIISQYNDFLPIEALMKSNKSGDYIIKDYAISYTYSAQFLLKNKSENSFFPNKSFIGFAPVNFPNLASLNGSKKSISNLANHYFFNTKLIEKEASKTNFLSQANSYKIVQLYTHAQADSNDTEPRIYFADSTLKVSELSAENQFKTQLLVLSACKTGVGKLAKGEGILSLARGFSMLGIPATITSLWSVEDADTYQITELFYNFVNKGFGKDEALQKAKIDFLKQSENPQPYAWAGMVLVGETEPISNSQLYLWIIAAVLTIGILGFLLRKYKNHLK